MPIPAENGRSNASTAPGRVLVVGGAGYIGSVLTRQLLDAGRRVRVFDALLYGSQSLSAVRDHPNFELVIGDTRNTGAVDAALDGIESVVHLGELVGDPACGLDPAATIAINRDATRRVAELAREHGVRRFVYPSSCSVYGASDKIVDEESPLNPVSLYAEVKVAAEGHLRALADDAFEPVLLRLATVFGHSARPRFDLVVNLLAAQAQVERRISVHGGGQWRPFVHVSDVAAALVACLDAPSQVVAGRTFNVGSDTQNHTIGEIASIIQRRTPNAVVEVLPIDDHRNYRVSFARIRADLRYVPAVGIERGIAEVQEAIRAALVRDYAASTHSNVRTLREAGSPYRIDEPLRVVGGAGSRRSRQDRSNEAVTA